MKMFTLFIGVLLGVVLAAFVGGYVFPNIGVFDMSASGPKNFLDWWGNTNLDHVVERNAPQAKIPAAASPDQALEHYASVCVHCHGAPQAPRADWAQHMLPKPPELWEPDTQEMTDGELFYVVHQGVRMTGMPAFGPTHSPEEIWNLVALIRRLDKLSEAQTQRLQASSWQSHRHGDSGGTGQQ